MAAPVHPASGDLEDIVIRRKRRARLSAGLTAPYLEDFAAALAAEGHRRVTICRAVRIAHWFGGFATANGVTSASELSEVLADRFVAKRVRLAGLASAVAIRTRGHVHRFLSFLRERGVIVARRLELTPAQQILEEFIAFVRDHRGIRTFDRHRVHVGAFLAALGHRATPSGLSSLEPASIRQFLMRHCEGLTRSGRMGACAAVRGFLRFARVRGYLTRDLVGVVPVTPRYRLDRVPPVLAWEDIQPRNAPSL